MRVVVATLLFTACAMPEGVADAPEAVVWEPAIGDGVDLPELALRVNVVPSVDDRVLDTLALFDEEGGPPLGSLMQRRVCQLAGGSGTRVIAALQEPTRFLPPAPCVVDAPEGVRVICLDEIVVRECRGPLVELDVTTGQYDEIAVERAPGDELLRFSGWYGPMADGTMWGELRDLDTDSLRAILVGTVEDGIERRTVPEGARMVRFFDRSTALAAGIPTVWNTSDGGRTWTEGEPAVLHGGSGMGTGIYCADRFY